MNIENATPQEIQQFIYQEIANGKKPLELKEELRQKGVQVEGYYFMPEAQQQVQIEAPASKTGVSGWQIFVAIVLVIVMILRIVRCADRMG